MNQSYLDTLRQALDALIDFHKIGVSSYYAQEAIPKLRELVKEVENE